jgi:heme/copper-type cytochrome/quinol oxidase subunit 2
MNENVGWAYTNAQLLEQSGGSMRRITMRVLVANLSAFFLVLAACLLQSSYVLAQDQKVQVIELTAKKYEYSGSPIHVKAGTRVELKITAADTIMVSQSRSLPIVQMRVARLG